jgi:hypothetical protein
MPNSATHRDYIRAAIRLILTEGGAPSAAKMLVGSSDRAILIEAVTLPDYMNDIACGGEPVRFGHNMASCAHFQPGYCWGSDTSLSLAAPVIGALAALAGMRITVNRTGLPAPLAGLLEPTPMERAVAEQDGATLGGFLFSSAGEMAEFYGTVARNWFVRYGSRVGWLTGAGVALHMAHDSGEPHHAIGALFNGHQPFEDQLEAHTTRDFDNYIKTRTFSPQFSPRVREELTAMRAQTMAELCIENAQWSRRWFDGTDLTQCTGDQAVALEVRSVAVTIRGLTIMSKGL